MVVFPEFLLLSVQQEYISLAKKKQYGQNIFTLSFFSTYYFAFSALIVASKPMYCATNNNKSNYNNNW
jgi:hypothetical protein